MKWMGSEVCLRTAPFDLFHIGHLRYLREARNYGHLTVTVTGDRFVKKGPGRPVFPQEMRAEMIAALRFVDAVAIVPDYTALMAIRTLRPTVYCKGSDYVDAVAEDPIHVEMAEVLRHGGRTVFIPRNTPYSSGKLLSGEMWKREVV